ncbi:MAG: tRNA (guanosine(37)-N1)-methyltransferase TrmD [Deltaproteobacteria bacterium RIFOXYA12_FULL_61_11]|nr:MAG: tRNA (guanosine(37)-N1)-methyltransferase TrmD [Deltaproteobacteria bacterium RIFOXYA12_FULL_61_11]
MIVEILTVFPNLFASVFSETILHRALEQELLTVHLVDLRGFARGGYVDDYPFSGGPGMVIKSQVVAEALASLPADPRPFRVFLTPQGMRFTQAMARSLAGKDRLQLLCGRYEGVDQRVIDDLFDLEVSLGDFVLSGGEIPAMAVVDAVTRLLPGALGNQASVTEETFENTLLKGPVYTRPRTYADREVPAVLVDGNSKLQKAWRREQEERCTRERRPDLLRKG